MEWTNSPAVFSVLHTLLKLRILGASRDTHGGQHSTTDGRIARQDLWPRWRLVFRCFKPGCQGGHKTCDFSREKKKTPTFMFVLGMLLFFCWPFFCLQKHPAWRWMVARRCAMARFEGRYAEKKSQTVHSERLRGNMTTLRWKNLEGLMQFRNHVRKPHHEGLPWNQCQIIYIYIYLHSTIDHLPKSSRPAAAQMISSPGNLRVILWVVSGVSYWGCPTCFHNFAARCSVVPGPGTRVHLGGGHVFGQASIRGLTRDLGLMIQGLLSKKSPTGATCHGPLNLRI